MLLVDTYRIQALNEEDDEMEMIGKEEDDPKDGEVDPRTSTGDDSEDINGGNP